MGALSMALTCTFVSRTQVIVPLLLQTLNKLNISDSFHFNPISAVNTHRPLITLLSNGATRGTLYVIKKFLVVAFIKSTNETAVMNFNNTDYLAKISKILSFQNVKNYY